MKCNLHRFTFLDIKGIFLDPTKAIHYNCLNYIVIIETM